MSKLHTKALGTLNHIKEHLFVMLHSDLVNSGTDKEYCQRQKKEYRSSMVLCSLDNPSPQLHLIHLERTLLRQQNQTCLEIEWSKLLIQLCYLI